jgi:hypothetical protein
MEKAKLIEMRFDERGAAQEMPAGEGKQVEVQFNPETLKVTFANQLQTPSNSGDNSAGSAGRQYVGAGSTKLALTLWFDVSAATDDKHRVDDVRRLTQEVIYFMTPKEALADPTQFAPPGVRFLWGQFKFDGLIDSLEESLEFFSAEGKPLRASIALGLSQQAILKVEYAGAGRMPGRPGAPGTQPLTPAASGASLQGLAAGAGAGADWQAIAQANGIENPRRLEPGQLVNLNLPRFAR